MTEALRTYDIKFDQNQARELVDGPESFTNYLVTQMETNLGERFNIELSRYEYDIKDGNLWGKDMDEPFIGSLKRGRDYRRLHGSSVDWDREEAEVVGFERIENTLLDPDTDIGTMMLSISPRGQDGSSYQHNFYDVFTLKEDDGKKFVEARRYASGLGIEDYKEKLKVFGIDDLASAEDFLRNPIKLSKTLIADDIHAYFQSDTKFMDEKTFDIIKKNCRHLIEAYAKAIAEEPDNDRIHKDLFNTILNKADDIKDKIDTYGIQIFTNVVPVPTVAMVRYDVANFSRAPVREVMTGCGASGGYETGKDNASQFSVSTYAPDRYGDRAFKCPDCNKENVRPYNKLLSKCQHCDSANVAC